MCLHSRRMCLRYYVLGFAAHFIISGADCLSDNDCFMDDDRYVFMGYGTDFDEYTDQFYD